MKIELIVVTIIMLGSLFFNLVLIDEIKHKERTITIKQTHVYREQKPEEKPDEYDYDCEFLKELKGNKGRTYFLWQCEDEFKLYNFEFKD